MGQDQKSASQIGMNGAVKNLDAVRSDGCQGHRTSAMHNDAGGAEGFERGGKKPLHLVGFRYVGLYSNGCAASFFNCLHHFLCLGSVASVVDDNVEAISCQAQGNGTANASRSSRNNGGQFGGCDARKLMHDQSLKWQQAQEHKTTATQPQAW